MNRGIARRTIFESVVDIRMFLSRLAIAARSGRLEVHAYCILTTHFHLLVRSPVGELSGVMQMVQNEYSRWFNRSRCRDGPLFRSRFCSKPVESLAYREQVVRYIDANPLLAALVKVPSEYPHCSARCYAQPRGPIWLTRTWVESVVCSASGAVSYDPLHYADVFGCALSGGLARLIEQRVENCKHRPNPFDDLDDLLGSAPERVRTWMQRKAANADGTMIGQPVCDTETVSALVANRRDERPGWRVKVSRKTLDAWMHLETALLRDLCGAAWSQIGSLTSVTGYGAWKTYERHRTLIRLNTEYADAAADLASRSLARCYANR